MAPIPDGNRSRRAVLGLAGSALLAGLAGCASGGGGSGDTSATETATEETTMMTDTATGTDTEMMTSQASTATPTGGWRTTELTDVQTGNTFTVQQFAGKPVLLEFFAVWCPICTKQQRQLATTVANLDELVAISINVDPNEDAGAVKDHLGNYDFNWRYAIAPSAMTKALIDEFGSVISSPPAAPVVRICPDGGATLLEGQGVKSAETLETAIEQC